MCNCSDTRIDPIVILIQVWRTVRKSLHQKYIYLKGTLTRMNELCNKKKQAGRYHTQRHTKHLLLYTLWKHTHQPDSLWWQVPVPDHVDTLEISLGLLLDAPVLSETDRRHVEVEGFAAVVNEFVPEWNLRGGVPVKGYLVFWSHLIINENKSSLNESKSYIVLTWNKIWWRKVIMMCLFV